MSEAAQVSRDQVKDFLKNMSLMEAAALVKELEQELGVSAAAPVAVAAAGPAAGAAAPAVEKDEFTVADFMEGLRFVRGKLHFDADYIRGRRIKTSVAVCANGTVKLQTIGRGKAVLRWLDRIQGKKLLQSVGE